eukprot:1129671-Rhodomonas_salina.1
MPFSDRMLLSAARVRKFCGAKADVGASVILIVATSVQLQDAFAPSRDKDIASKIDSTTHESLDPRSVATSNSTVTEVLASLKVAAVSLGAPHDVYVVEAPTPGLAISETLSSIVPAFSTWGGVTESTVATSFVVLSSAAN